MKRCNGKLTKSVRLKYVQSILPLMFFHLNPLRPTRGGSLDLSLGGLSDRNCKGEPALKRNQAEKGSRDEFVWVEADSVQQE